jgi:hypothetical protein
MAGDWEDEDGQDSPNIDNNDTSGREVAVLPPLAASLPAPMVYMDELNKKTPKKKILQRQGAGNMSYSYIPWGYVAERMNKAFDNIWSKEIVEEKVISGGEQDEVVVKVRVITALGVQEAYGSGIYYKKNKNATYGDAAQSALSKAFRRAVAPWGIGLDLYLKEGKDDDDDRDPQTLAAQTALLSFINLKNITPAEAVGLLSGHYNIEAKDFGAIIHALQMQDGRADTQIIWDMVFDLEKLV